MLIGFNNDVQYRGKTFHIQTEDRGLSTHQIETQIFHAGAILDTRIVSYAELMSVEDSDARNVQIRKLMQVTHRELYLNLFKGKYDQFAGLEPRQSADTTSEEPDPDSFTPSQERVPDAARLVEEGRSTLRIQEDVDHVDLNSLKAKLARITSESAAVASSQASVASDDEDEDDMDVPTQITSLDALPEMVQTERQTPQKPSPSLLRVSAASTLDVSGFKPTGHTAWPGCLPPQDDLSIVELVEALLA